MNEVKSFVIDRSKWLPREAFDGGKSYLLRESDGRMCCLGVYLRACGIPASALNRLELPAMVVKESNLSVSEVPAWLLDLRGGTWSSESATELASINDSQRITLDEREQRIIERFAEQGIEVRFEGELFPEESDQ
jgi:hypothetical protein